MESNIYGGDNKYKEEETFTLYLGLLRYRQILPNPGSLGD